jgi:hypothetical protein
MLGKWINCIRNMQSENVQHNLEHKSSSLKKIGK